jgi:hypothetical protein
VKRGSAEKELERPCSGRIWEPRAFIPSLRDKPPARRSVHRGRDERLNDEDRDAGTTPVEVKALRHGGPPSGLGNGCCAERAET